MFDSKLDVLVFAIILSAAAHIGIMYWVSPRVMTHTTPVERSERRHQGPMQVTAAPAAPAPVGFDEVKDQVAERPAPDAKETIAAIFAPPPNAVADASKPILPETPRVLDRIRPADGPETLPAAEANVPAPVLSKRMEIETVAPIAVAAAASPIPAAASSAALTVKPPAPAQVPPAAIKETPAARVERVAAEAKPAFKPSEQVYAEVDEDVVRREKEAVRDLMSVANATDMSEAVAVSLVSAEEGGYTYFKATVRPRPRLPIVPKDVVVIIDASGSIGDTRLKSCREAARKILRTCTNSGDRFNLVAFRNRFSYAFLSWRDCDKASFTAADGWLDGLAAHGRTDVFSTIRSVLTLPRDPARPLVALVVTDGDANVGVSDTRAIISQFTKLNDGLISVYMYGVRRSGNRELIDMLTHGNRGESLMYDGINKSVSGEGVEKLSERFRDPVLTDLRVVFPTDCPALAYPTLLKNLYRGDCVEILGRLPGSRKEIAFSLRGLAGPVAYEGLFRLPAAGGCKPGALVNEWKAEADFDGKY